MLQSPADSGHPEPRPAPHRTQQAPCGCYWQERGHSFEAAESISLLHLAFLWAAKKTPSDLQGSDLRHSSILLAIALGSDCVAERLLQKQHPPTPKVKKYLPSNFGSIELWPVRHCITKLSYFYSTGEFEALRSKVRAQKLSQC